MLFKVTAEEYFRNVYIFGLLYDVQFKFKPC